VSADVGLIGLHALTEGCCDDHQWGLL
jgi:hypothetical protein